MIIKKYCFNVLIILGIICSVVTIWTGCNGNFGRLRYNPHLTHNFFQTQSMPDYNFYYNGRWSIPYALVGIKKGYEFNSKFWKPIDDRGKELVRLADRLYGSDFENPLGADILDPHGHPIGIWYSVYSHTRVQFGPDNQVKVFSPYVPTRQSRPGQLH